MQVKEISGDFAVESVVPFFQPVINIQDNVVWSYECLARLVTQSEQTFLPSEFLNLVEENHCVGALTQRIFHHSAQYFRDRNVEWSINISEQDVLDPQTIRFLSEYLQHYPSSKQISLELMATTVKQHPEAFSLFIKACKELGLKIIVDHVSGVWADSEQILDFPIDAIKIDGNLLVQLIKVERHRPLLKALRNKAIDNNIIVVAERIEDEQTLSTVVGLNIRYGQGFYFSKPAPALS